MGKMRILQTGSSDAVVQRCEQRSEQVLLGKAGLLLHHRECRPGGHTLKLLSCQLVFEVQEIEYLKQQKRFKEQLVFCRVVGVQILKQFSEIY